MRALIYIALNPSMPTTYDPDLLQWVRTRFPEIVVFDFDNYSTAALADYAIELIKRADSAIVVIVNNGVPENPMGAAMSLFQFITREKKMATQLLLHGKHTIIEKMGQTLDLRFYQTPEKQVLKEKISMFLSQ